MSIHTWRSPDNKAYIRTRKAIRAESQRITEENQKRKESEELWAWYADYDVAESFTAQDRARDAVAAQGLREAMKIELLAVEMDQAASETSDALNHVKLK